MSSSDQTSADVPPEPGSAGDNPAAMTQSEKHQFDVEAFLATLPRRAGVYRMLAGDGSVLYVGKARSLKSRVTSYFRAGGLSTKTIALVNRIASVEVTITSSETEALLLEQSWIKQERPPYNVVLRDDKSYPFIHLTADEAYPRLAFHRGVKRKSGRYFGPYPSAGAVRESLNLMQKLFQVRQCEDSFFKNRTRPCLQYQIERCSAPCVQAISEADYAEDLRLATLFLEGRNKTLLEEFKNKMESAAAELAFERAAKYRDQIKQLRRIQEQQYVHGEDGDVDIFAIASDAGVNCVQGVFVRGGRVLGHRTWFPRSELDDVPAAVLEAFISQYYFTGADRELPRSVIVSEEIAGAGVIAEALSAASGRKVALSHQVRGQRARWQEMALENARISGNAYIADQRNVFSRFVALQEGLGLDDLPTRLECFDISHTGGEKTVASCVVFDHSGPLKSDYRRFNIDGIEPGDDYAAIEQAVRRRYTRLKNGEAALPDVLLIDGGDGQLAKARLVLEELQITNVALLGVAKGPTRKAGFERLLLDGVGEVFMPPSGAGLHLIQHIRDEAHRFAITGHRQRRAKSRTRSELDEIEGIGPKRKRELLAHFGGVASIKGASRAELAKVPGISERLAGTIFDALHVE